MTKEGSSAALRSALGRVRALGSARAGTHHWWMQRLTAIALVPLTLWFVIAFIGLAAGDYPSAISWFASPLNVALLLALVIALFYHAQLGMQVIIEDYLHTAWLKMATLVLLNFVMALLALAAIIAALKVWLAA